LDKKKLNYRFLFFSLDNELKKNSTSLPRPPPIPPRQTKSDEKTTTTSLPPPSVHVKQSNPATSSGNDNNNVNTTKGLSTPILNSLLKTQTKISRIIQ